MSTPSKTLTLTALVLAVSACSSFAESINTTGDTCEAAAGQLGGASTIVDSGGFSGDEIAITDADGESVTIVTEQQPLLIIHTTGDAAAVVGFGPRGSALHVLNAGGESIAPCVVETNYYVAAVMVPKAALDVPMTLLLPDDEVITVDAESMQMARESDGTITVGR